MGPYPNKYLRGSDNDDETMTWEDSSQFTQVSGNPLAYSMNPDYLSAADQQTFFRNAKRAVDQMNGAGQGDDVDRATVNLPPAAVVPGRGAELGLISRGFQTKSRLKIPMGNAKLHNAFAEQLRAWEPVLCKMQFVYKGILNVAYAINDTGATRYCTHQFYRHSAAVNNSLHADTTLLWNETLGPDVSLIRQIPPAGSAYSVPSGYNTSLVSCVRYPQNQAKQAVRLTRVLTENIGWNANPIKFVGTGAGTVGSVNTLQLANQAVYANAPLQQVDGITAIQSLPALQPKDMNNATAPANSTACYYRCQTGVGSVSYQFANDGNAPVVVDIVVTKMKKGQKFATTDNYVTALKNSFGQGYLNMCLGNRGVVDMQGLYPQIDDVFLNSKVEFMPQKALSFYDQNAVASGQAPRGITFVARDQFIVDAGSVKPYSLQLPALNYDPRDYDQSNYHVDDLSYCVSVAYSTLAIPVVESGTVGVSVIDRRGASLNMTCSGVYTEKVHPVYLAEYNNNFYINGILQAPYYGTTPPTLARQSILPVETANRGSTVASSYIDLGATNTQSGA